MDEWGDYWHIYQRSADLLRLSIRANAYIEAAKVATIASVTPSPLPTSDASDHPPAREPTGTDV